MWFHVLRKEPQEWGSEDICSVHCESHWYVLTYIACRQQRQQPKAPQSSSPSMGVSKLTGSRVLLLQVAVLWDLCELFRSWLNFCALSHRMLPRDLTLFEVLLSDHRHLSSALLWVSFSQCFFSTWYHSVILLPVVVVLWSHVKITGKNRSIEPLSKRKTDVSKGGQCLLHLPVRLSHWKNEPCESCRLFTRAAGAELFQLWSS